MLNIFRNNKKSLTALLLVGFAAVLMVSFGLDINTTMNSSASEVAIKVDDEKISRREYAQRYNSLMEMYGRQFGQNFGSIKKLLNLEQRTIDGMIEEVLIGRLTAKLNLAVGPQQIEQQIAQLPYFQKAGMSKESYQRFLQAQGMSAKEFEQSLKNDIMLKQINEIFSDVATPSNSELLAAYEAENVKAEFEYIPFAASAFSSKVNTSDETKLKEYYQSNAEVYRRPKSIRYAFVRFPAAEFMSRVSVSDDELKDLYSRREREFTDPKEVHLRQIVVNRPKVEKSEVEKMMSGSSKEETSPTKDKEKREALELLKVRVEQGESFAEIANATSEDAETAAKGGDLGWKKLAELNKEFRGTVDRLSKGEVSQIVSTPDQYILFYAEEIKESALRPFESVKAKLEEEFRASVAPEYARAEADSFLNGFRESASSGKSLQEYATSKGRVAVVTEKPLSRSEDAPDTRGLTAKLISYSAGESEFVMADDQAYVANVLEVKDSSIPELNDVKERVLVDFRAQQENQMAKAAADEALKKLQARGENDNLETMFQTIAKENGIETKRTGEVSKAAPGSNELFNTSQARQGAFSLTEAKPVAESLASGGGVYFVYRLLKKVHPTKEETEKGLDAFRTAQSTKVQARMYANMIESLKASANIWISPELIERDGGVS